MLPNTIPRKGGALMRYNDVIERSYIKHPSLGRSPIACLHLLVSIEENTTNKKTK
jgi:hypothetical protein